MTRGRQNGFGGGALAIALVVAACAMSAPSGQAQSPAGDTLDRIRETGRLRLGYRIDARPFSYRDDSGKATGYSVALCEHIVSAIKAELNRPIAVEWIAVSPGIRFSMVHDAAIDLMCAADTVTLERQKQVAFSTPIFPGGTGALLRRDAPIQLRDVLNGHSPTFHPTWRAAASQVLQARAFSAVKSTTAEAWLSRRISELEIATTVVPMNSYETGVEGLLDRQTDALFGERAILLSAAKAHPDSLIVLDRLFTYEPLGLALGPNDEALRLLVDRALSRLYPTGDFASLYAKWFGAPDDNTVMFFRWNAVPE